MPESPQQQTRTELYNAHPKGEKWHWPEYVLFVALAVVMLAFGIVFLFTALSTSHTPHHKSSSMEQPYYRQR